MEKQHQQQPLWVGRFSERPSEAAQKLGESISFDKELYREDIIGSIAHTEMLCSIGILSQQEKEEIHRGLLQIRGEIESGQFQFKTELEDIHSNIERRLTEIIGATAGKMHTARSRNDQVITDTMLWLRGELIKIDDELRSVNEVLWHQAQAHIETILPGYTHMQVAQPIRLAQHLLAYMEKFNRDKRRLEFAAGSLRECPLGSGAMAGVNYPIDRYQTASLLGFQEVTANSMESVSSRDWLLDFHHFASTLFIHLSRIAEEWILWSSVEFQFVSLSQLVTTGSSIMPQKKNPDVAELIRGKSGRVIGNHVALLAILKGLPLTYNRDLQEDKEGLFDTVKTIHLALKSLQVMVETATFRSDKMQESLRKGYALATDVADYLVKKGIPFRQTHEIVGSIIQDLEKNGSSLEEMTLTELKKYSPLFEEDYKEQINYSKSTDRKESYGSTSRVSVVSQLKSQQQKLEEWKLRTLFE